MGNQESSIESPKISYSVERDLSFVEKKEDERYGEVKVMRNNLNGQLFAVKSKVCTDEEEFRRTMELANNHKEIDIPTIIRVIDVQQSKQDEFCSQFYKVYMIFEY